MQEGGVLLVAPEHRLSLQLKQHETWLSHERQSGAMSAVTECLKQPDNLQAVSKMMDQLQRFPYVDILDESDEVLHHRCKPHQD
jgi:hypothetical protein